MNKAVINKLDEYRQKYEKRKKVADNLTQNYKSLMKLSDDELRLRFINLTGEYFYNDEVYNKICSLIKLVSWDSPENPELKKFLINVMNKFPNRTMTEQEYNYFLNNSNDQILRDNKGEKFYYKKSLWEMAFGGRN